jgi:hypothetical protein
MTTDATRGDTTSTSAMARLSFLPTSVAGLAGTMEMQVRTRTSMWRKARSLELLLREGEGVGRDEEADKAELEEGKVEGFRLVGMRMGMGRKLRREKGPGRGVSAVGSRGSSVEKSELASVPLVLCVQMPLPSPRPPSTFRTFITQDNVINSTYPVLFFFPPYAPETSLLQTLPRRRPRLHLA